MGDDQVPVSGNSFREDSLDGTTGANCLIQDGSSWKMSYKCYLNEVQDERDRLQSFTGESVLFHAQNLNNNTSTKLCIYIADSFF